MKPVLSILLSTVLLSFCVPAHGAESSGEAKNRLGRAALSRLLQHYQGISKLKAKFHETKTLQDISLQLESDGVLTVERPDRVIWEITKPASVVITLSKKELTIESGEGANRKRETIGGNGAGDKIGERLKGLVAWLQFDIDALLEEYEISATAKDEYEMLPRRAAATPFTSLTMTLKTGGHLERLLIREKSGDSIALRFAPPTVERTR